MKIHLSKSLGGAAWTDVCHSKEPFIWVSQDKFRPTSRWQSVERKNQYRVEKFSRTKFGHLSHQNIGYYKTLEKSLEAANKVE